MIEQLKFINQHTGLFKKLANIDKGVLKRTDLNKIGNLYFHKHFSMGISAETLRKINAEILKEIN
jgi:diacylglycerol kinase family enzyme